MTVIRKTIRKKKTDCGHQLQDSNRNQEPCEVDLPAVLAVQVSPMPDRTETPLSPPPFVSSPPDKPDMLTEHCAQSAWNPQSTMLFLNSEQSFVKEQFRTLRSQLFLMREQRPLRKLLVTSALPNEGKSFVSANLAQVIACQQEQRVLLMDGDLRGGNLHHALGASASPGFSDYLQQQADEFNVLQRGAMDNLFFLSSGRPAHNPAELVANGHLKTLLTRLEELFDWIIIDSPPALPVSDATMLADCCDGVVLVVRSNVSKANAVRRAKEQFCATQLIGSVLNGAPISSLPYCGSYRKVY